MIGRSRWLTTVMALSLTLFLAAACGQAPSVPTATSTLVPTTPTPVPAAPTRAQELEARPPTEGPCDYLVHEAPEDGDRPWWE